MIRFRWLLAGATMVLAAAAWSQSIVTFVHTNDLHAHADPTKVKGTPLGGYARLATALIGLRDRETNAVLLNAGDTFQGTLYFNVYEGLADLQFLNLMGFQAAAVGNHEFDRGPGPLATYAKNARFPLLAANLDLSDEPLLKDWIKPSAVVMAGDQKLGVIGAITPDVLNISSPGKNVHLKDLRGSIRAEVIKFEKQGIHKIVLLSHCGYELEQDLARTVKGLDVIVGGHSHTLLGDPKVKDVKGDGAYPTVITTSEGRKVLLVQAWEWGKVAGRLRVEFDANDEVKAWDGAPVPITADIPENPTIASLYETFNRPIAQLRGTEVGSSSVALEKAPNTEGESLMGNVLADAMLAATAKYGTVAAFTNAGGVRSSLPSGQLTYGQLIEVTPFGNTLVVLDLTGRELVTALGENLASGKLYPSKGTSYVVKGDGVAEVMVAGKRVDLDATYTVAFNSFTAGGGDKHAVLGAAKGKRTDTGIVDLDALIAFIKGQSPVRASYEGRIRRG